MQRNTREHESIDTIVVAADDIVASIERNARDRTKKVSHYIRLTPPFEAEVEGELFASGTGQYPPEMDPKPIHIPLEKFHDADIAFPERGEIVEDAKEIDGVSDADELSEEAIEKARETAVDVWESQVRRNLNDEIDLTDRSNPATNTVEVRYEE